MDTEVYFFHDDQTWVVVVGDSVQQFNSREEALRTARALARLHAPSVIIPTHPQTSSERHPLDGAGLNLTIASTTGSPRQFDSIAGPPALGRSLLTTPAGPIPDAWRHCDRISVSEALLNSAEFLEKVRNWYLSRTPIIFELPTDFSAAEPSTLRDDVWAAGVTHEFLSEAAWQLMTRNAVDIRRGNPSWPLGERALELGASSDQLADVLISDGVRAWCDGGPLRLWDVADIDSFGAAVIPRAAIEMGLLSPVYPKTPTAELAPDQLAAVTAPEVRARIIAPAGSGKTRVLTERARYLIQAGVPASAMLLVAFNRRAQAEIADRTADLPGLQVQTLNALGLSILNGSNGLSRSADRVQTIDEREVRELLSTMIQFPRRPNTDPAASWIDALAEVRLGLRSPQAVEAGFNGDVEGFADFFPRYRSELRRSRKVDFDEQIYGAIEVLLTKPDLRGEARTRAQLLLVDEFQDLTPAHVLMLRLLAGPEFAIFGVGDDDQTIYGYSGASPEWLVSFDQYVPMAEHHDLTINYRCPAPVINAARNLLSRNQFRVPKAIATGPTNISTDESMEIVAAPIPVFATLDLIKAHLVAGAQPSEIAVLTRVNTLLAPVQAALRIEGIPVQNRDGTRFLERAGVTAALAWMQLAVTRGPFPEGDIIRAARRPTRGLSARVVEWMGEQHDITSLERLAARISDEKTAAKVLGFARDLAHLRASSTNASSAAILESIRIETGLDQSMRALDAAHHGRNSAAHSDDLRALVALGHLHPDPPTFPTWVRDVLRPEDSSDGVTIATVHRVKGLEWPHVIVYDATSGIFPHRLSTDIEEERRVFHVAITRAKRSLQIVTDESNPSMFLEELTTEGSPPKREARPTGPRSQGGRPPKSVREQAVSANLGLVFSWGGYECTVSTITDAGVVVSIGSSTMTVPFGSEVMLEGRVATLTRSVKGSTPLEHGASNAGEAAVAAGLKAWRLERARKDEVPAYVVFDDKTLQAIVLAMPSTEQQLLAVSGMGPKRVELYGDEVIAFLDAIRPQT